MGSPPNEPYRGSSEVRHEVTISKPFYIQTTEVTVKQWHSIMGRRMMIFQKIYPTAFFLRLILKLTWRLFLHIL